MPLLQKPWTDLVENPTAADIDNAIIELQEIDRTHNAFWVTNDEEDMVLEVQKDLRLTLVLCGEICRETRCKDWKQAKDLYSLLLLGEYDQVKEKFDCLH